MILVQILRQVRDDGVVNLVQILQQVQDDVVGYDAYIVPIRTDEGIVPTIISITLCSCFCFGTKVGF